MADGKHFLTKLIETFDGDATLQGLYSGGIKTKVSYVIPVGNRYPQITVWLDEGKSETIFPAGWYKLTVTLWLEKKHSQKYKFIRTVTTRINELVNRKASSLSEIDIPSDEGLRVARCVKDGGEVVFNKQVGKYFNELIYDTVISEDESFDPDNAGNKPWV